MFDKKLYVIYFFHKLDDLTKSVVHNRKKGLFSKRPPNIRQ